jgi:hypothetical protein
VENGLKYTDKSIKTQNEALMIHEKPPAFYNLRLNVP